MHKADINATKSNLLNKDNFLENKSYFIKEDLFFLNRVNFYNVAYYTKDELFSFNKYIEKNKDLDLYLDLEDSRLSSLDYFNKAIDIYKRAIEVDIDIDKEIESL